MKILILGSGPGVITCRDWPRAPFDAILAINNAWAVRPDWDILIHPEDFPPDRLPPDTAGRRIVTAAEYVPANNAYGGIVYAGATMAFTAGYWALATLRPRVMAYLGCDMIYDDAQTHFYGAGTADPLRDDPTLQDLTAKSARLELLAAQAGCAMVNLSDQDSRLTFARATPVGLGALAPAPVNRVAIARALAAEADLGAYVASGRYWRGSILDAPALAGVDALWLGALADSRAPRS